MTKICNLMVSFTIDEMKNVPEEVIIHHWWNSKNIDIRRLKLATNQFQVIDFGKYNAYENGPDFTDAQIRIDELLWCGSVEIHLKASDWDKHGHQYDENFNNVILHVVQENDKEVYNAKGEKVLTVEIAPYSHVTNNKNYQWIPCENLIDQCDNLTLINELEHSLIDRLNRKVSLLHFEEMIYQFDYNAVYWLLLFRSFGNKVQTQSYEQLFYAVYPYLSKIQRDFLPLLLGVIGFEMNRDEEDLWLFLKNKFAINHISSIRWKTKGFFAASAPQRRIRQLAESFELLKNIDWSEMKLENWLSVKRSLIRKKILSPSQADLLLINSVSIFYWWYAQETGKELFREKAVDLLTALPPERNSITKGWKSVGVVAKNAFDSQALLELKNQKCNFTKCLECKIGQKLYGFNF